jgi:hypothetical protein
LHNWFGKMAFLGKQSTNFSIKSCQLQIFQCDFLLSYFLMTLASGVAL